MACTPRDCWRDTVPSVNDCSRTAPKVRYHLPIDQRLLRPPSPAPQYDQTSFHQRDVTALPRKHRRRRPAENINPKPWPCRQPVRSLPHEDHLLEPPDLDTGLLLGLDCRLRAGGEHEPRSQHHQPGGQYKPIRPAL
jgi:hypothetical protein